MAHLSQPTAMLADYLSGEYADWQFYFSPSRFGVTLEEQLDPDLPPETRWLPLFRTRETQSGEEMVLHLSEAE